MDIRVISVPFESTLDDFKFGIEAMKEALAADADEIILVTDDPDWLRLTIVGLTLGIGPSDMLERGPDSLMTFTLGWVDRTFKVVDSREYEMPLN